MKSTFLNKSLVILGLGVITILSSCQSTIPFTNTVKKQYNLDEAKLKKMQFYVSHDITLQRGERGENSQELDGDGKLVVSSSSTLNEILVDAKTPGICIEVLSNDKLKISFFEADNQYLIFGDPNNRGRYELMTKKTKKGRMGIQFGGKSYYVNTSGARPYLKFELKKVRNDKVSTKKAKGRTVN